MRNKVKMHGFIIFDSFPGLYPEFAKEMTSWIDSGQIQYKEQIIDGLENAPAALNDVLLGNSFGKVVVKVG